MAEWQVERGIGETRAILVNNDQIMRTRHHWDGELIAGSVVEAKLISKPSGAARGTARLDDGTDLLVDRLDKDAREGAMLNLTIMRSAISEKGRMKLAHARPSTDAVRTLSLTDSLAQTPCPIREVRRFSVPGWSDLVSDSLSQSIDFNGGSLLIAPTAAMLVVDIDGTLPPRELALAAVPAIAATLRQMDIGGMVGIDFPTLPSKADRRLVDMALERALDDWPHERTAMNGFGFVQLVSRLERPSLFHRAAISRSGVVVRNLLRQAEHITQPGAIMLTAHPAISAQLKTTWVEELARRSGRQVRIETRPSLAPEGSFAQSVPL
ncbi:ribonuclease [Altererythrobacter sp. RZ02]|uniref:Ribonuclease n=1 Tax=Pontixanthobacter rizhaonensis TaxID=2730337 RepID=A0A848QN06_9SPHN|nr:ribonuclease E/G [Pontixanthobacter rizhaonensis]NMW30936.1 ribonuclease [Pontixanthobacter rizhaonensis]